MLAAAASAHDDAAVVGRPLERGFRRRRIAEGEQSRGLGADHVIGVGHHFDRFDSNSPPSSRTIAIATARSRLVRESDWNCSRNSGTVCGSMRLTSFPVDRRATSFRMSNEAR